MKSIKKLFGHSGVKNSVWIIGERIVQMMLSFVITMISARYLGPSNYGVLNYGASFVTFFAAIMKLGIDNIIVNDIINNRDNEGVLLGTSLFLRLISSFLSIIMIIVLILVFKPNQEIILITTILQSIALIFQAISILEFWFQSNLQSKYVSIAKSIAYIAVSAYKIFLLINKYSVTWFAISTTLDYFLIALIVYIFYKKKHGKKLQFEINVAKKILKKSYHFIVSSVMVVIYTQMDKIMIGNMIGEEYVGYYSAALALHTIFSFIPDAIITSARPIVYNAKKESQKMYIKRLKQTFSIVFWSCIVFAFLMTVFSNIAIDIMYGEDYQLARVSLIILVWAIPFSQIGSARSIWIVSEGYNKYVKRYLLWGAIINIVLNYFLIQHIGMVGAAIATLVTEFFVCMISPLFYKDTRVFTKMVLESMIGKYD